jgi:S1-C subfamily serine protease
MNPITMPETKQPEIKHSTASSVPPPVSERPARRGFGRSFAAGLMIALLGFGGGIAGYVVADQVDGQDDASTSTTASDQSFQPANDTGGAIELDTSTDGEGKTPRAIYKAVSPSVVHITSRATQVDTGFFGIPQEQETEGTGSGFVIDDKGHIVTNAHVVEGAEELTVSFGDEATTVKAKIVGEDKSSDIAVIKVNPDAKALKGVDLTPLTFADSRQLQVGDPVLAIGNPYGLDRTLTTGVVSALQREIPSLNDFTITDVIQTDAAVNPGNSGGPLLDAQGRVIGVNSQIKSQSGSFAGIAFAVPSDRVRSVANKLIKDGKIEYAWLGIAGGEITPELVKELDLPVDEGVLIGTVTDGSPADDIGLQGSREVRDLSTGETSREGGDVVTSLDGVKVTSMRQLAGIVDAHAPGDNLKIEFIHDGKRESKTITLGTRPDEVSTGNDQG